MEKHVKMSYLIDIYSPLLTKKQTKVLEYYYSDDLAISEIARLLEISRQGVYDALRRAESVIEEYDSKLGLFERYLENSAILDEIKETAGDERISSLAEKVKNNL